MKKRKLLILSLFVYMSISCVWSTKSRAEDMSGEQISSTSEMKDENSQRLEQVTGMDQEGNVTEADDSNGSIEPSQGPNVTRSSFPVKVVNFNCKGNATTDFKEVDTGMAGYTNGAYAADAAYLGLSDGKIKFMLAGVVGLVDENEVQVVDFTQAKVVSCYKILNGRLVHYIAYNLASDKHAATIDNGEAPEYLSEGTIYYSYDGHYFYTDYSVMLMDYQNNTRSLSVNANEPYYNYYQYLPLRSQTTYSGNELNAVISGKVKPTSKMLNIGEQLIKNQNAYGVNALIMAGVAANESGWGSSSISQAKNNLFGLNAVDSSPGESAGVYETVDDCIQQFASGWMSRQYLFPENWKYKGGFLGNKGSGINVSYASDPYWGEKAASIAGNLDRLSGTRDLNAYTLGIKGLTPTEHTNIAVRSAGNVASSLLYWTGRHAGYSVLVKDSTVTDSFYKIQSDAVLNKERTGVVKGVGEYSVEDMYAYISSEYVTIINEKEKVPEKKILQSIYISQEPTKTIYTEGEIFDPEGMKVIAKWSDGTETDVTLEVVYRANSLKKDDATVTMEFSYEGVKKMVSQNVTVKENVSVDKVSVDKVEVNPDKMQLEQGASYSFSAVVIGTGNLAQTVTWSVEGSEKENTKVDKAGKLEIADDETAEKIQVKAMSTVDKTKCAVAEILITVKAEAPGADAEKPKPDKPNIENPGEGSGTTEGGSGEAIPPSEEPNDGLNGTPETPPETDSKIPDVSKDTPEGESGGDGAQVNKVESDNEREKTGVKGNGEVADNASDVRDKAANTGDDSLVPRWMTLLAMSVVIVLSVGYKKKVK